MNEVGVGLLGFGTVGAGVVEALQTNAGLVAERLGVKPVLRRIADVDLERDRGVRVDPSLLTRDAAAVIHDPAVDVIVELIGGTGVARTLVMQALEAGKPVVTANKALLSRHGSEIYALAERRRVDIGFGASVGGGIPIVRALRDGLIGNRIESIVGILNGTCNYILTRMETDGVPFGDALREAQREGFAEADPALDIDGLDTAHKAVILASLAYGFAVPEDRVHVEGIRDLSVTDIRYALDMGYRIKLLAVIKRRGGEVEVRVNPTLVPLRHMLASVGGVFNAAMVQSDLAGQTLYYGRGAGRRPTASTVVADIADVIRNRLAGAPRRLPAAARPGEAPALRRMEEVEARHYFRLSLLDKPNVLARISTVLGSHNISIAAVQQKEVGEPYVPVVILTHAAREKDVGTALDEIAGLDVVDGTPARLLIED